MLPILRIVGEDVLFTHWRVKPERLKSTLPAPLTVDTYDGSGWVTVLAHEVTEAGLDAIPVSPFSGFGEVDLRTYVTFNEDQGVFFFSCNTGQELNALLGEQVFGLPHRRASVSFNRRGEEIVVRCRQTGSGSAGRFDVKYQPTGTPSPAEPGSLMEFLAERHTYFSPTDPEKERPGSFIVGSIERDPWQLSDVNTDIRTNTMFDRLPTELPSKPSEAHYSPRFESRFVGRETVKI
jgi:uncharacterized protein YqjF (DUF2071 family)